MSRFAAACEVAAIAAGLLLGACDSGSGPVDVKLGRDVCEMCGMIISDPRFLAEVRLADGKIHKFDDVGDAVNWLSSGCHGLGDIKEFWVIDSVKGKTWLDARKAFYRRAETPMNYGFAAVAAHIPARSPSRICARAWRVRNTPARARRRAKATPDPPVRANDMNKLMLAARLDVAESLRARWFLLYVVAFGGIVALLMMFGVTESRVMGFTGLSRLLVTYLQLTMAILPIFILISTVRSVAGDREAGVFEYMLALPAPLAAWYWGRFVGRFVVVLLPVLLAMGLAVVWGAARGADVPWGTFLIYSALLFSLSVCFLGIRLLDFDPGALGGRGPERRFRVVAPAGRLH